MLKKTIKYKDFNEDEVEGDFYFNLTKAELAELEMSHKDGMVATLQRIIGAEDNDALYKEFKNIILLSYGQRSPDGRRFVKSQEFRDEFISSQAFSDLIMELLTNTAAAIEFFNGLVPAELREEVNKIMAEKESAEDDDTEKKTITKTEIEKMDQEDFQKLGPDLASGRVTIVD